MPDEVLHFLTEILFYSEMSRCASKMGCESTFMLTLKGLFLMMMMMMMTITTNTMTLKMMMTLMVMMKKGWRQHQISKVPEKRHLKIYQLIFVHSIHSTLHNRAVPELVVKTLLIFCAGDGGFGTLTASSPGDFWLVRLSLLPGGEGRECTSAWGSVSATCRVCTEANTGCSLVLSALAGGEWNCEAKSSSSSSDDETVMFGAPVGSWEGLKGCPDASSFASSGNKIKEVMVQNNKHYSYRS